jgi:hypothetical protein
MTFPSSTKEISKTKMSWAWWCISVVMRYSSREMGHQGFSESNIYYHVDGGSVDSHAKAEP